MVNIPGAEIEAVDSGIVQSRHRAVVGALDRPTPLVKSQVVELNFYPYWHVPESIVKRDLVPTIREDFDYLKRTNLRVFTDWGYSDEIDPATVDWNSEAAMDLKFRQEPGDGNALGYVKINFPNEHQVYLHDTPKRRLFGEELRAYSSGCVRVQNVDDLVAWILGGQEDWSQERVQEVIQTGESRNVPVRKKVQLHMTYVTAWATTDGMVHFRRDLYGRDGVGQLAANY
jgi:murein L,D-transpeptidase YcbB/YkuD